MKAHFSADRLAFLTDSLNPMPAITIADVGANPINESPYRALADAGFVDIIGFEPGKVAFAALAPLQSERETYLPYAIGDGGKAVLNICKGGGFSSLLKPDQASIAHLGRWQHLMKVVEEVPVQTHRLDDLEEVPAIDLLKIDVQGAELDVFRGGRQKLSNAAAVITEVAFMPLYEGQPLFDEQMAELRAQGFMFHKFLHYNARSLTSGHSKHLRPRRHVNQIIDGDAVFIRDIRDPTGVADETLKALAILADGVLESFDLAVRCLDILTDRKVIDPVTVGEYAARVPHSRLDPRQLDAAQ